MADQLATPQDLASLVQSDLDLSTATVVIEAVTAVVQEAAGNQRLIQVVNDPFEIEGTTSPWLVLPQRPVTAVSSVVRDDGCVVALGTGISANYKKVGNRLWSRTGWQAGLGVGLYEPYPFTQNGAFLGASGCSQTPTIVSGLYSHGYVAGSQDLQLARSYVLAIARGIVTNAVGATSESIDDYHVAYDAAAARVEANPSITKSLRRKYGARAGLARIG